MKRTRSARNSANRRLGRPAAAPSVWELAPAEPAEPDADSCREDAARISDLVTGPRPAFGEAQPDQLAFPLEAGFPELSLRTNGDPEAAAEPETDFERLADTRRGSRRSKIEASEMYSCHTHWRSCNTQERVQ